MGVVGLCVRLFLGGWLGRGERGGDGWMGEFWGEMGFEIWGAKLFDRLVIFFRTDDSSP